MFFLMGIVFFLLNCGFMVGAVWLERALSIPQYTVLGPENGLAISALSLILTMMALIPISRKYYPQGRPKHPRRSSALLIVSNVMCFGEAVWIWLSPHPMSMRVVSLVLFAGVALGVYSAVRDRLARSR